MRSGDLLQTGRVTLAVIAGIIGTTIISYATFHRIAVLGIVLGAAASVVLIILYELLAPIRERRIAKALRGMIALVFAADAVCFSALLWEGSASAVVGFWGKWAVAAHFITILIVIFATDSFQKGLGAK